MTTNIRNSEATAGFAGIMKSSLAANRQDPETRAILKQVKKEVLEIPVAPTPAQSSEGPSPLIKKEFFEGDDPQVRVDRRSAQYVSSHQHKEDKRFIKKYLNSWQQSQKEAEQFTLKDYNFNWEHVRRYFEVNNNVQFQKIEAVIDYLAGIEDGFSKVNMEALAWHLFKGKQPPE